MALKTVNFYRGVSMTTLAKIAACQIHTATGLTGMAGNAGFQTVLFRANPAAKRVVALMFEKSHVVASHESRVSHALAATGGFDHGLRHTP